MSRRKFIETNSQSIAVYAIVFFFVALYVWRLATWALYGTQTSGQWTQMLVLGMIIGIFSWFLLKLKLEVKVGKKSLKVRMNDGLHPKAKIKWKDIKEVEPFKIPEAQLWSGMNINFDHNITQYNLGDNCGLKVVTNDDKVYLIYSEKLYKLSDKILSLVKKH